MSDKKLRVFKLRNASDDELVKGLDEYKKELNSLRTLKITGAGSSAKLGKIRVRNCISSVPSRFHDPSKLFILHSLFFFLKDNRI